MESVLIHNFNVFVLLLLVLLMLTGIWFKYNSINYDKYLKLNVVLFILFFYKLIIIIII